MAVREFSYKGRAVTVDQPDEHHADVTIGDRGFAFTQHGDLQPMWRCDDAYFGSPELDVAIRQLVDYWHLVSDDRNRAPVAGREPSGGGRAAKSKPKRKPSRKPANQE